MTKEEIEFLEKNFHLYEMIKKAGFVKNYSREIYVPLLKIYEQYISKKHNFAHHCSECRFFLVKYVFQFYEQTIKNTQDNQINDSEHIEEAIVTTTEKKKRGRKPKI